jgi:hypothetical protein
MDRVPVPTWEGEYSVDSLGRVWTETKEGDGERWKLSNGVRASTEGVSCQEWVPASWPEEFGKGKEDLRGSPRGCLGLSG